MSSVLRPPVMQIDGEQCGRGFLVVVHDEARTVAVASFEFLLELLIARKTTRLGYLYIADCRSTDADEWRTRQVVHRLRKELRDHHKSLIETGRHSYRLTACSNELVIGPGLFEIPPTLLDERIVTRLKAAC